MRYDINLLSFFLFNIKTKQDEDTAMHVGVIVNKVLDGKKEDDAMNEDPTGMPIFSY
jgi:hypothetical protein